jgi:type II secretory pathway pseudopilin PulG
LSRAFSLVEVVVAVGIFAISIVAVIGLLAPVNKNITGVRDTDDASRVVSAIQAELQRVAETPAGWTLLTSTYLRTSAQSQADDVNNNFNPATTTYTLFSSRDGDKVGPYASTVWDPANNLSQTDEDKLKFFEIAVIRNGDSPANGNGLSPQANDLTAGFLAFTLRLRWPAYNANGERFTDNTQKSILLVPAAVHR